MSAIFIKEWWRKQQGVDSISENYSLWFNGERLGYIPYSFFPGDEGTYGEDLMTQTVVLRGMRESAFAREEIRGAPLGF